MTPHPQTDALRVGIQACLASVGPWTGAIYRFATVRYSNRADLLSGLGSKKHGGRWNPQGLFNCIYGSLDPHTAMEESLATFRAYGIPPEKARSRLFVAVALKLQNVFDLTDPAQLAKLTLTTSQLSVVDWEAEQSAGREALTQAIGRIAWEEQVEGILVPCARTPGAVNLALFPGRRRRGSSWKIQGARDLPKH